MPILPRDAEGRRHRPVWLTKSSVGWFLLGVGLSGLLSDLLSQHFLNLPFVVITALGCLLVVSQSPLWERGDSYQTLQKTTLTRPAVFQPADLVAHFRPLPLMAILLACIAVSFMGVKFASQALLSFSVTACAILLVAMWWAHHRSPSLCALFGLLATALLVNAAFLHAPLSALPTEQLTLQYCGTAVFIALILSPAIRKRALHDDIVITTQLLTGTLFFIWLLLATLAYPLGTRFLFAMLTTSGVLAGIGLLAWVRYSRISYAKHFFVLASVCLLIYTMISLSALATSVMLVLLLVCALLVGFLLPSYSARQLALVGSGFLFLWYGVIALPATLVVNGSLWLRPVFWCTVLISALFAAMAWLYNHAELRQMEQRLQQVIVRGCTLMAFATLVMGVVKLNQSILLLVIAAAGLAYGERVRSAYAVRILAAVTAVLTLLNLVFVQLVEFSTLERLLAYGAFAILFLVLSWRFAPRSPKHSL